MVPSRIDVSEGLPIDRFEARFRSRLDGFTPPAFRAVGTDFTKLRIPYISAYAFDERLAIGDPQGVKALKQSYGDLALHVALLGGASSAMRARCGAALREKFGLPAVVVFSVAPELEPEAERLRRALSGSDLIVLSAPAGVDAALDFTAAYSGGQRQALSLVVVSADGDAQNFQLRPLRLRARELGVALRVVSGGTSTSQGELDDFVHQLRTPDCSSARADARRRPWDER